MILSSTVNMYNIVVYNSYFRLQFDNSKQLLVLGFYRCVMIFTSEFHIIAETNVIFIWGNFTIIKKYERIMLSNIF